MANKKLDNLVRIRQLKAEHATEEEIAGLLRSGIVRLADAKNEDLNKASRFDLAYNAAHALSLAALRKAGYRSENRYLVFQCTQHTLNLSAEHWRILDHAHRKRNLAEYEGEIDIDDQLLEALIRVVTMIAGKLQDRDKSL
jgi:hypothetical protein